jgi:hypothetical protein
MSVELSIESWSIFLSILGAAILWQWDMRLTSGWRSFRASKLPGAAPVVDVVMCVRNGETVLPNWLAAIGTQTHVQLRITVVDDGSTDGTPAILRAAMVPEPHTLEVLRIEGSRPGKKDALATGLAAGRGPWVWLTDVDCLPMTETTVARMVEPIASGEADVVAGVSLPTERDFAWADAVRVARTYVGLAGLGMPYMAVGRNWAFRRECWPGLERHAHIASGDDDLTFQEMLERPGGARVTCLMDREAQTTTKAPKSSRARNQQKLRHLSTGAHYPKGVLFLLAMPTMGALLWATGLVLALNVEVFHTALWIAAGAGGALWTHHALTFRSFVRGCGVADLPVWLGWGSPGVWVWLAGLTLDPIRFPRRTPPRTTPESTWK